MTITREAAPLAVPLAASPEGVIARAARVPKVALWMTLMAMTELVRFTGFMVLLLAIGGEKVARSVISR